MSLATAALTALALVVVPPPRRSLTPPRWNVSFRLGDSTIAMPCSDAALMPPSMFKHWAVLSWDWSNAKDVWINQKPMDSEGMLLRQIAENKRAAPGGRHLVYRNTVHAMPWFRTVLEKLQDPHYAGYFLRFGDTPPLKNGSYFSSRCDDTWSPPRCTQFYHDQTQTPSFVEHPSPHPDGLCSPTNCDCGGDRVPCGMYLFNHLNASFADWFVNTYIGGPAGLGHPDVSGFFFDDFWCWDDGSPGECMFGGVNPQVGPAETEAHVLLDLGMDLASVRQMAVAWRANMDRAYTRVLEANAMSWDLAFANSYNVPAARAATVPRPTIIPPDTCEAILTRECSPPARPADTEARDTASGDGCCCATRACPNACPAHCPRLRDQPLFFGLNYTSKQALSDPDLAKRLPRLDDDIAQFLLVRGPYAWLGFGFVSCGPATNYSLPDAPFTRDYGVPLGNCSTVQGSPGKFRRAWSKATVEVDCLTGTTSITYATP